MRAPLGEARSRGAGLMPARCRSPLGARGASLVHLPAMGLSPPMWKLPPSSLAPDLGFHLAYGLGAAVAFRALDRG